MGGAAWGADPNTLLNTFKMFVRSSYSYAAGVWGPVVKPGLIVRRLQPVQNAALRFVTGCHSMASEEHVHQETKVLRVRDHTNLLCAQLLASALRPSHPSFGVVTTDSGPRHMKGTLFRKFYDVVRPHLVHGNMPAALYNLSRKRLHANAARRAHRRRKVNRVLNHVPPPIHRSISTLPRQTQRIFSQLRSGHSSSLKSYQHRVGRAASPSCPDCLTAPQTSIHLFECPSAPTALVPIDLWKRPRMAASFLAGSTSFPDLALDRGPPPPPSPIPPPLPSPPPPPPPSPVFSHLSISPSALSPPPSPVFTPFSASFPAFSP